MKPKQQTDFMKSLYQQYGRPLATVRIMQSGLVGTFYNPMMDDIECEWLYLLVRHLAEFGAPRCLEIGPCSGWSSSWILRAITDAGRGWLVSVDPQNGSVEKIPTGLQTSGRWSFIHGLVEEHYDELPDELDFLLIDSNHDSPAVEKIHANLIPRVRPGGIVAIHDIYMLATPAQGEAVAVFKHLKSIGQKPFTPAKVFTQSWRAIQRVRKSLNLGDNIMPGEVNPMLFFMVPELEGEDG